MAAIVFPPNPALQTPVNTFSTTSTPLANTSNTFTYTWNGTAWTSAPAGGAGGGTVTTVSGTLPISVATGTTTPVISIAAATAAATGSIEIATLAEAATGTDATRASTPETSVPKDAAGMTGAAILPAGTDAQRAAIATPVVGMQRFNTTSGYEEVYTGATLGWRKLDYVLIPATLPPDLTISADTTLNQGTYYVNNLTINAGVTVTSTTQALVFICTGDAVINGTIDLNDKGPVGGGYTSLAEIRFFGPAGQGLAGGGINLDTNPYTPVVSIVGSAGGCGVVNVGGAGLASTNPGGPGGGGVVIRAYGSITTNAGSLLTANGRDSFRNSQYGTNGFGISGSGGGSGGTIVLHADELITHGGAISGTGGAGSNAYTDQGATQSYGGGGGGGGGVVIFQSPFGYTGAGTVTLTGGAGGVGAGTGTGTGAAGACGGSNGGQGGGALVFTGPGGTLPYALLSLTGGNGVVLTTGSPF